MICRVNLSAPAFFGPMIKETQTGSLRVQWHENVDLDLVSSEEHWPPAGLTIIPKSSCVALEIIWHNF
jgi:hypothetical protein